MTNQQAAILRLIAKVVLDGVRAAGSMGAPAGTLYAALMTHGCTMNQFTQIMSGLVQAKVVREEGNLYFEGAQARLVDMARAA